MTKKPRTMRRRRFVTLVAMSGAAALTAPLSRLAAAPAPARRAGRPRGARRPLTPAIHKELANQEKTLTQQLDVIRKFELPPGSPLAFVFRPLRARKGR